VPFYHAGTEVIRDIKPCILGWFTMIPTIAKDDKVVTANGLREAPVATLNLSTPELGS
jgi:hypothetical protein